MTFNGLHNVPTLFFIIILMSLYAMRNRYLQAYGVFTMFVIYWIQLAVFLTLTTNVITGIEFVDEWVDTHQSSSLVTGYRMVFGMRVEDTLNESEHLTKRRILYYSLMLPLMFLC